MGPKTLILIRLSKRVETNAIMNIIQFLFQKLLRYRENCEKRISRLPKVITFDLTVGISISLAF